MSLEATLAELVSAIRENTAAVREVLAVNQGNVTAKTTEPAAKEAAAPAAEKPAPAKATTKPAVKPKAEPKPAPEPEPEPEEEEVIDEVVEDDAEPVTYETLRSWHRDGIAAANEAGDSARAAAIKAAYPATIRKFGGEKDGKPFLPGVPEDKLPELLAALNKAVG